MDLRCCPLLQMLVMVRHFGPVSLVCRAVSSCSFSMILNRTSFADVDSPQALGSLLHNCLSLSPSPPLCSARVLKDSVMHLLTESLFALSQEWYAGAYGFVFFLVPLTIVVSAGQGERRPRPCFAATAGNYLVPVYGGHAQAVHEHVYWVT